ncbi:hypothetical protein LEN26_016847 [Aphanomyces euteiches]|nr:hypothetical protein LEN26_016847 [Aphanomyces euteiches]KAH9112401.1 hypothetical protein AeMF1_013267 [Aphanomyces euteiches]KAH9182777.1 hypothetical protein AeNC1_015249 [Aphanomyces euteiches]
MPVCRAGLTRTSLIDDQVPRRIRKAETVLQRRTARILLVLEASCDMFNQMAVLRTAECFGNQRVWIVEPAFYKEHKSGLAISLASCPSGING